MSLQPIAPTLRGLEALTVDQIANRPLIHQPLASGIEDIEDNLTFTIYDQVPIYDHGKVVGVYEKGTVAQGAAGFRPIDDSMLVSGGEPLLTFLPTLLTDHYRLVVRGTRIDGIVTTSDLNKLAMRTLAYTLISHYEQSLAHVIVARTNDCWFSLLSSERMKKLDEAITRHTAGDTQLEPIEFTELTDKHTIIRKALGFPDRLRSKALVKIEDLRNPVAHSRALASDVEGVRRAVQVILLVRDLIGFLEDDADQQYIGLLEEFASVARG